MFKRLIFALFFITIFNPGFALNRDYCTFDEGEDGKLHYDDLQYLDDNNDQYDIYAYAYCVNHFNKSYLPYSKNLKLDSCLPEIDRCLLYLIPPYQIPGYRLSYEAVCYASLDANKLCLKPVNYPGYLDYDFHEYDPFLEEQLVHFKSTPLCQCYWPEYSKEACRISDVAYLLFRDLFASTALSKLINNEYEQLYLLNNCFWELNLHGLSVSCVARSFWFSHYYRLGLHLLEFAQRDCELELMTQKEVSQIYSKLQHILLLLANEYTPFYEKCLNTHPSEAIQNEIAFLCLQYPNLINCESRKALKKTNIQIQKLQQDFDLCNRGQDRTIGIPMANQISENLSKGENYINSHKFFAEFYLYQGLYLNDILDFRKAIEKFDTSLKYDNRNKLTYLARAYAHFELRNYEQASADYAIAKTLAITPPLMPDCSLNFSDPICALTPTNRIEFSKGFVLGGMQGFNEGTRQFVPSILHTITGIGQGLWIYAKDPVHISQEFMQTVGLYVALAKGHLEAGDYEDIIPEMNELLGRWAALTDFEKGRQIGLVIGKYGIDVFLTGKTVQLARKFREVKYANGALTLEACENYLQRNAILKEAEQRSLFRQSHFKNDGSIKIHKGKQGKHFLKHDNFEDGNSYFTITYEELVDLCMEYAGTGEAVRGEMGKAGYKEKVNFGKIVGIYVTDVANCIPKETSVGMFHYDAKGEFHVVPGPPKMIHKEP